MKATEPWISSQNLRALLQHLDACGVAEAASRALLADSAGQVDNPEARFPAQIYLNLMELGERNTGDPWFGHHYGATLRPERWGVAGYMAYHCASLGEALAVQQRYQVLVGTIGTPSLQQGAECKLCWHPHIEGARHVAEEIIAGWQVFVRTVAGAVVPFREVTFAHPAAGPVGEIEAFYDCPVQFEGDCHAVRFDADALALRFRNPDAILTSTLRKQADAMLSRLETGDDPQQELQRYLLDTLPDHVPELEELGTQLNLSPRTLQRRLKEWGTTYKQLLDETRRNAAIGYFDGGGENVLEITFLLGFSEQAAFHRAFKRWTGQTPGHYRDARRAHS